MMWSDSLQWLQYLLWNYWGQASDVGNMCEAVGRVNGSMDNKP